VTSVVINFFVHRTTTQQPVLCGFEHLAVPRHPANNPVGEWTPPLYKIIAGNVNIFIPWTKKRVFLP
jgi:hypothetical protein